ncbi:MAG: response regulator [bacterium]
MLNKTVLVVEDEMSLQDAIKIKLNKKGFDVLTARTIEEAEKQLNGDQEIDVIWLDHYLIGPKNGLDFVIELKISTKWQKIPIFVVSNTASPDKVKGYLALGVNKYYTKSDFKLDTIIEGIKNILDEKNI